jgi:ATP-binding cassette subfamily C (CFTR/MRP) protein 1
MLHQVNHPMCRQEVLGGICSVPRGYIILCPIILPPYLTPSRLLDIEAKAPLYTHFLEIMQGISTVRAFNWESQFQEQNQKKLDFSQKPFYMLFCIQQWLTLVLDLIVGAIAVILAASTTSFNDNINVATIGVGLNLVLTFNQDLGQTIISWISMETSIGAVSRVQTFVQDTPSEERQVCRLLPENGWPSRGLVKFENVTAGYR